MTTRMNINNALERRLRKMVKYITEEEETIQPFLLCAPKKISKSLLPSLAKLFLIVVITTAFFYQVYDRISYYLSEPTAVDVFLWKHLVPSCTVCYGETKELIQLRNKYSIPVDVTNDQMCLFKTADAFILSNLTALEFWRIQNATKIIQLKSNKELESYSAKRLETYLPNGLCVTIDTTDVVDIVDMAVTVDVLKLNGSCPGMQFVYIHSPGEAFGTKYFYPASHATRGYYHVVSKKYKFIDKSKRPCSSKEDNRRCFMNCLNQIQAVRFGCRLPYLAMDEKFPWCSSAMNFTRQTFLEMQFMLNEIDREKDCNCTRKCEESSYYLVSSVDKVTQTDLAAQMFVTFSQKDEPVLIERFNYDFISLIIDIGGIMGLYFGWSILSFAEIGYDFFSVYSFFNYNKKYTRRDPIFRKVKKCYESENQRIQLRERNKAFNLKEEIKEFFDSISFNGLSKKLVILFSALVCIYEMYISMEKFLSYPVTKTVEIEEKSTMSYPNIVICTDSISIMGERKKLIAKGVKEACDMELVDFIKKKKRPMKLWKESAPKSELYEHLKTIVKKYTFPTLNDSTDIINTPFGYCFQIKIPSQRYLGTFSAVWIGLFQRNITCVDQPRKMFFEDPITGIDFLTEVHLPQLCSLYIDLKKFEMIKMNTPNRPCVEESQAKRCKIQCIQKKLRKHIQCSLPYMNGIEKPECNDTKSAKESQQIYFKIFTEFQYNKDCKCIMPCTTTVVTVSTTLNRPWNKNLDLLFIFYRDNIVEYYIEIGAFGVVAFLCNVGNYLGLTLGISVLSSGFWAIRYIILFCSLKFK